MTGDAGRIFCSYARADAEFVLRLAKDMKSAGANIWLDQLDIPVGRRWDSAVEEALRDCEYLLVVLSPSSVESQNVMDEVSFGFEEKKRILPVLYRDCAIPFRLRRLQYSDFTVSHDAGLHQLYQAVGMKAPEAPAASKQSPSRPKISGRIAGALGAALVLITLVAVVLFSGQSGNPQAATADSGSRHPSLAPMDTATATPADLQVIGSHDSTRQVSSTAHDSAKRYQLAGCQLVFDTRGTVKWFSDGKGYGMIAPSGGGEDILVEHGAIQMEGFRSLAEGELVALDTVAGSSRPRAKEVFRLEDSNHVRGSKARICIRGTVPAP